MANLEHLATLKHGVAAWNNWREQNRNIVPDLSGAELPRAELGAIALPADAGEMQEIIGIDLSHANLENANLEGANLRHANLSMAQVSGVNLVEAQLANAYLVRAQLVGADLNKANLARAKCANAELQESRLEQSNLFLADLSAANLSRTRLRGAQLTQTELKDAILSNAELAFTDFKNLRLEGVSFADAYLHQAVFIGVDLRGAKGLELIHYHGPSYPDISTLYASGGEIPEVFLRGCGVPDTMITFAKSLVGKSIQYYSAFISYSSEDEQFARRLHNDLQKNGVRVWFAPEDLKIGETIEDSIDQAIRVYDKLILVLSQNSIGRAWVRREFSKAVAKENQHGKTVLFPIRLDNSVFDTTEQWAYDLHKRHIGDFRNWTNPLLYQNAINRLLRDLNANPSIKN